MTQINNLQFFDFKPYFSWLVHGTCPGNRQVHGPRYISLFSNFVIVSGREILASQMQNQFSNKRTVKKARNCLQRCCLDQSKLNRSTDAVRALFWCSAGEVLQYLQSRIYRRLYTNAENSFCLQTFVYTLYRPVFGKFLL